MALETEITVKEGTITNNCPICFNQGLELVFYQKHFKHFFYNKLTKKVSHRMKCLKCTTEIFPVNWTDDIERSYTYYEKTVIPQKATTHYTWQFYLLLVFIIGLIAGGYYYFSAGLF